MTWPYMAIYQALKCACMRMHVMHTDTHRPHTHIEIITSMNLENKRHIQWPRPPLSVGVVWALLCPGLGASLHSGKVNMDVAIYRK